MGWPERHGSIRLGRLIITKRTVCGAPDLDKASTSVIERQICTTRGEFRRMTSLSNGFLLKRAPLDKELV